MNYLEEKIEGRLKEIIDYKIIELEEQKKSLKLEEILDQLDDNYQTRNFLQALSGEGVSLIAEVKKASPSAGDINTDVNIVDQAKKYESAGANAISVLTDKKFFKGDLDFLQKIKNSVSIPVLRKDFIFDPYQVYQSKLAGADAILLIATILTDTGLKQLLDLSHELGMTCLVEAHNQADLYKALESGAKIIGINARDLKTFEINLQNVIDLAGGVPPNKILIAESGIKSKDDVVRLNQAGAKGILVGTTLMQAENLSEKIKELKLV